MKTAVIYARYSCDAQSEQSIEGQLRVCEDYAKMHDILILDTYIDRAMSGTNDMRPDFQRMIRDSAKRQWSYVLVYKLDTVWPEMADFCGGKDAINAYLKSFGKAEWK